jgi:hypothetical protein
MRIETPQRGNPHALTVNQHVFPVASIERFAGKGGRVWVHDVKRNKIRPAKPGDIIFCARRAWDQRAEHGYMHRIESEFQLFVEDLITGAVSNIGKSETRVLNQFYALWYMRARYRELPYQEIEAKITGSPLTVDQEEILERAAGNVPPPAKPTE